MYVYFCFIYMLLPFFFGSPSYRCFVHQWCTSDWIVTLLGLLLSLLVPCFLYTNRWFDMILIYSFFGCTFYICLILEGCNSMVSFCVLDTFLLKVHWHLKGHVIARYSGCDTSNNSWLSSLTTGVGSVSTE